MKFISACLDELERSVFCLREDGALFVVRWQRDLTEPTVKLLARLPDGDPPDSATA